MRSIKNLNEKKQRLARNIARYCERENMSALNLFKLVKQDRRIIEKIFAGNVEEVELQILEKIARELGV